MKETDTRAMDVGKACMLRRVCCCHALGDVHRYHQCDLHNVHGGVASSSVLICGAVLHCVLAGFAF
ncbi:hypothetical protein ACGLFO_02775 [Corynebacterium hesseae]|uniref:hypothetical protein n=1 Tax=Corynebacterium hesseae TaxID=2913502 RepID=UPI00373F884E